MGCIGLESKGREATNNRVGVEHPASLKNFGAGLALFHEVDGIFGQFMGLVGVSLENNGGEVLLEFYVSHLIN